MGDMPEFCKCKYRTFFSINRYFARKIANFFEINSLTTDFYPPLGHLARIPSPRPRGRSLHPQDEKENHVKDKDPNFEF